MIEKIKLTNFQSHLDTEVDLVPGINVLIGSSDNGKSAILRGLYWNWRNRPLGDGFIKDGEEFSEVTVNYKNRKSAFDVLRRRGKSENLYKISTLEDSFIAGTNVPKEIEEAINFSDINFQSQFSPYFLVFDSPGSIATYIRSVTGLNEIDKVVKSLTTKKNNTESEIKKLNTDLKLLEEKLEKLNKVPVLEIERNIQKAKNLSESLIVLKREKQKIESLIFQIKECEKSIICIPEETLPMLFSEIESLSEEYKNVCLQNNQLKECIQTYQSLKKSELKVSLEVKDFGIELAEEYLQNKNQLLNLNENIQTWKSLSSKKERKKFEAKSLKFFECFGCNAISINTRKNALLRVCAFNACGECAI